MDFNKIIDTTAKDVKTLNFMEALKHALEGKHIHKLEWVDKNFYGLLKDAIMQLHKSDGKFYQWVISEGDMSGTDWIVL